MLPILESLIPGYAIAMREALDEGGIDDLRRMLDLLIAVFPPHSESAESVVLLPVNPHDSEVGIPEYRGEEENNERPRQGDPLEADHVEAHRHRGEHPEGSEVEPVVRVLPCIRTKPHDSEVRINEYDEEEEDDDPLEGGAKGSSVEEQVQANRHSAEHPEGIEEPSVHNPRKGWSP